MSDFNYKCPACGGQFNTWSGGISKKECPFCGREKGDYGNSLNSL